MQTIRNPKKQWLKPKATLHFPMFKRRCVAQNDSIFLSNCPRKRKVIYEPK
ncbi:hypothetical protein RYX36_007893, partial [Vicia faba]